jgi:transposase-like protein
VLRQTISTITAKVLDAMTGWQNRPLGPGVYPVVFIDAIHIKIRGLAHSRVIGALCQRAWRTRLRRR